MVVVVGGREGGRELEREGRGPRWEGWDGGREGGRVTAVGSFGDGRWDVGDEVAEEVAVEVVVEAV